MSNPIRRYNTIGLRLGASAIVDLNSLRNMWGGEPFWINFYDWSSERYAAGVARCLENVPGVYGGQSGYTTGYGPGRLPMRKWVHPDWRGPGNEGEIIAY